MSVAIGRWQRVLIVGGPGSGKTRLARQLAERTGTQLHHLDDVARIGGGNGPLRPLSDRERLAAEIADGDQWITEGVHLGWTNPLLERADVILWIDDVSWLTAAQRISRRFVEGGVREARSRHGRQRVTRFRDYGSQLRAFGSTVLSTRRYYATTRVTEKDLIDPRGLAADGTPVSRATTEAHLAHYSGKVLRCRSAAEVAAFLERAS